MAIVSAGSASAYALTTNTSTTTCHYYPGDAYWPPAAEWEMFNTTVGGRLVETVPIASVCHYDNFTDYDAAACTALREVWDYPQTHDRSSSSPMATKVQGLTRVVRRLVVNHVHILQVMRPEGERPRPSRFAKIIVTRVADHEAQVACRCEHQGCPVVGGALGAGGTAGIYCRALSGGGGGTYAAVLSVTVRAYPDMRFAGANLTVV